MGRKGAFTRANNAHERARGARRRAAGGGGGRDMSRAVARTPSDVPSMLEMSLGTSAAIFAKYFGQSGRRGAHRKADAVGRQPVVAHLRWPGVPSRADARQRAANEPQALPETKELLSRALRNASSVGQAFFSFGGWHGKSLRRGGELWNSRAEGASSSERPSGL